MTACSNLDCAAPATAQVRYQAPTQAHTYTLCPAHTDAAHQWLAARPHLAATAITNPIRTRDDVDQPALFDPAAA